ncbi:hypothetical protein MC7420_7268 [Coleofasciculus chthonoplastes PCC 7420]|uniref:Uncharacterized protein n=1 Tax=Coleofasciculus chthonoplastes PCC 7420 TaxID=118168 RepID=B4VI02_9CYAN|nr:hypothetical protein MC7420_7268 [Coleofasciculus chthonoplastes PCC 7420]
MTLWFKCRTAYRSLGLKYQHTAAVRVALNQRYSPATAQKML